MATLSTNDPGFLILIGYRGDWKPRAPVMLPELQEKHDAAIREEASIIPLFDRRHKFRRPIELAPPRRLPPPKPLIRDEPLIPKNPPTVTFTPPYRPELPELPTEPPPPPEPTRPIPDPEPLPDSFSDLTWKDPERERAPEEVREALAEGKMVAETLNRDLREALAEGGVKKH